MKINTILATAMLIGMATPAAAQQDVFSFLTDLSADAKQLVWQITCFQGGERIIDEQVTVTMTEPQGAVFQVEVPRLTTTDGEPLNLALSGDTSCMAKGRSAK